VRCPSCNAFNAVDIKKGMGQIACKSCGVDLTELAVPQPLQCNYCGELCYNPCKKAKLEFADGYQKCLARVSEPLVCA
jgi:hypothetical protein